MKKLFLPLAALALLAVMTDCKKEDKAPTEVKDAQVVDSLQPNQPVQEVVGDVVDMNGNGTASGVGEATQTVTTNSEGQVPNAPVDNNNIP